MRLKTGVESRNKKRNMNMMYGFLFAAWFGFCLSVGFVVMGFINLSSAILTGTISSMLFTIFNLDLANRIHHAESDIRLGDELES